MGEEAVVLCRIDKGDRYLPVGTGARGVIVDTRYECTPAFSQVVFTGGTKGWWVKARDLKPVK